MNIIHTFLELNRVIIILLADLCKLRIIGKYGLLKKCSCFGKTPGHIRNGIVYFAYDIVDVCNRGRSLVCKITDLRRNNRKSSSCLTGSCSLN